MADKQAIADAMKEILGERTQRAVAQEADVDQTTIYNVLRGTRPGYNLAVKIANNLNLTPDLRRRFFDACGYADPRAEARPDPILEEATVQAFEGARELPAEDIKAINEEIRRSIEQRRKARGL